MKLVSFCRLHPRRTGGFTLVELLVVLLIVGILTTMAAMVTRAISAGQKRSLTALRLANIDAALVQFVQQQKRLPCPADISLAATNPLYGKESARTDTAGCTGTEADGVVPWIDLGLPQTEVTDAWDRMFTYRLQKVLAGKKGMDMSWCDPAGAAVTGSAYAGEVGDACNTTCTNTALASCTPPAVWLAGAGVGARGLRIKNVAGTDVMAPGATGAAYVVISHGESGGGARLANGQLATSTTTDGTEEQKNYANLVLGAYYVDDGIWDAAGVNHFDDMVSRPSVMNVVAKAGLGPRAH
jgi:prepilin-type N-terminal cleavage/methylation domain-containing protein